LEALGVRQLLWQHRDQDRLPGAGVIEADTLVGPDERRGLVRQAARLRRGHVGADQRVRPDGNTTRDRLQERAAMHYTSPARRCSFRWSIDRHAIARMDQVVFCVPPQTNGAASAMYTFFASCNRQKRSVTDVRGSS